MSATTVQVDAAITRELEQARDQVAAATEHLELGDKTVAGNAALRIAYLAVHALDRAVAICHDPSTRLTDDEEDLVYIMASVIDPRGRGGYDVGTEVKGALRAILTPHLGEIGFQITPEDRPDEGRES